MLVSAQELRQYMSNINLNAPQTEEAESTLSGVQSELETYLNRPLELAQIREGVRTDAQGYANLNVSPVWKVINLQVVEVAFLPDPLNFFTPVIPTPMERDTLIGEAGLLIDGLLPPVPVGDPLTVPGGVYVGIPGVFYIVEYIGGYNLTANRYEYEGVRQAIKRVAAREMSRLHDDSLSLREGNAEKASESDPRQKGWTDDELKRWDRLRRRVVV